MCTIVIGILVIIYNTKESTYYVAITIKVHLPIVRVRKQSIITDLWT